jgi:hypothetical protein
MMMLMLLLLMIMSGRVVQIVVAAVLVVDDDVDDCRGRGSVTAFVVDVVALFVVALVVQHGPPHGYRP